MNTKHALTLKGFTALLLGVTVMATSCKKDDSELMSGPNGTLDSTLTTTPATEGLTMGTMTPTSTSGLIFTSFFDKSQTGFNDFQGGDWNGVEAPNSNSITRSTEQVRAGSHSAKFILNKSDANVAGSKRAELTDWNGRMSNPKSERWYGMSMFLPSSYASDAAEEQLFQWHGQNSVDADGVSMNNSPMAMYTRNGRWEFGMKFGGKFDLGAYDKNVWTDWVLHIKFSPDGTNGIVEIWKNGVKVLTRTGKNTYNDKVGNYFKIGIYKYAWEQGYATTTTTRTVYYDEIRTGNESSSYAQVAPAKAATPTATTPTATAPISTTPTATTPTATVPTTTTPTEPATAVNTVVYAINTGGTAFKASNGITYQADKYFTGGSIFRTSSPISGTTDQAIYQNERYGKFRYALPIANGTYEVTFKFAEIYHKKPLARKFDIFVEGLEVISNLDIFNVAGALTKYDVVKTVTVKDGTLNIQTNNDIDYSKVSAFHIVKK